MYLGYYFADSFQYGDFFGQQKGYTNIYRCARSAFRGHPDGEIAGALIGLTRALDAGKDIQLALDIGSPNVGSSGWRPFLRSVLALEAARLSAIVAIELRDEPPWTEEQAMEKALAVRTVLNGRLANVPLGVTLDVDVVRDGGARKYTRTNGYGFVAGECYLPIRNDWGAVEAEEMARQTVRRLRRGISQTVDFWVVGQSYDRRSKDGIFGPPSVLKAIQVPIYEEAKAEGAKGLMWFSFGRPGGVESYPGLKKKHREIARMEGIL